MLQGQIASAIETNIYSVLSPPYDAVYQIQHPQGKLVRVIKGTVFDVAVDIRRNSETYGQWVAETLSSENKKILWIPPGFAHGFYVISKTSEFIYKCTDYYAPEFEKTLLWNDPDLAIDWPISNGEMPLQSAKDAEALPFKESEYFS